MIRALPVWLGWPFKKPPLTPPNSQIWENSVRFRPEDWTRADWMALHDNMSAHVQEEVSRTYTPNLVDREAVKQELRDYDRRPGNDYGSAM